MQNEDSIIPRFPSRFDAMPITFMINDHCREHQPNDHPHPHLCILISSSAQGSQRKVIKEKIERILNKTNLSIRIQDIDNEREIKLKYTHIPLLRLDNQMIILHRHRNDGAIGARVIDN